MIRGLNVILLVVGVVALVGVYALKYQSGTIAADKAGIERKIAEQNAELSLLRADWAFVNQPGHIEPIVRRHEEVLQLAIAEPTQFKSFEDLPMRPKRVKPDEAALAALFEALAAGKDPIAALIEAN